MLNQENRRERLRQAAAFVFLLLATPKCVANPLENNVDKGAHFGLSVVLVESSMRGIQLVTGDRHISTSNRVGSSILAFAAGLGKEIHDKNRGGDFSGADLVADGLGVLTGNLLFWEF